MHIGDIDRRLALRLQLATKTEYLHSRVMHDSSWHTYRSNQDLWLERTSAQMQTKPSGSASLSPHSRAVGSPAV